MAQAELTYIISFNALNGALKLVVASPKERCRTQAHRD